MGAAQFGGYRYSAFGETLEDTLQNVVPPGVAVDLRRQPLRWKGMWRFDLGGGVEVYDARARMWSPKLATFLSVDEFDFHDQNSTLWGWPNQNPVRWSDPSGRSGWPPGAINQALFDLEDAGFFKAHQSFTLGLLSTIPIFGVPGAPTATDLFSAAGIKSDPCSKAANEIGKAAGKALLIAGGAAAGGAAQGAAPTALHHVFPQEFAHEFGQIGIDIHQFTLEVPTGVHQDVHAAGWNADWKDFLEAGTSLPSVGQTQAFATELIIEYGLDGYGPLRPYR